MRITRLGPVVIFGVSAAVLAGAAGVGALLVSASADAATIPLDRVVTGKATYYNDAGYGACGTRIDANSQMLVAVSHTYWTTANPNVDPLCSGISVEVTYGGTTLTLPVVDKCPSCDAGHLDLSLPAFERLADPAKGVLTGVTWKFVRSDGTAPARSTPASPSRSAVPTGASPTRTSPVEQTRPVKTRSGRKEPRRRDRSRHTGSGSCTCASGDTTS
ncbi:MAG: hypothetical protein QG608_3755 [Actinomycetota bacterium]|nr:hypothetical protein [Actinomycetota bacterium]